MAITVQIEFIAKTTVRVLAYIYNDAGTLVNPSPSIKVTIYDPDGEAQVTSATMSLVDADIAGIYEYYYKTTTSSTKGWWTGEVVTIDGADPDDITSIGTFSFRIK